jgi:hypothetical protein
MTKATKGTKIFGGVLLGIILSVVIGCFIWQQVDDSELRTKKSANEAASFTHKLEDERRELIERCVGLTDGSVKELTECGLTLERAQELNREVNGLRKRGTKSR